MKKRVFAALLLAVVLLLCGCASSADRKDVKSVFETYFAALASGDFVLANSLTIQSENGIKSEIDDIEVNNCIFKNVSYDLWGIDKDDFGNMYADVVVHQLSLNNAIARAAKEYDVYVAEAENSGKSFSEEALEDKWNSLLLRQVKSIEETVSMKCTVPVIRSDDGTLKICMTADFRNCLFGGELDAIKALG